MILLDSNLIIYSTIPAQAAVRRFVRANETGASAISYVETLGFHRITKDQKEKLERFFRSIEVLPLESDVLDEAVRLRQERKISLGDALIAGTALVHNLPLATNNASDFRHIVGLNLIPV